MNEKDKQAFCAIMYPFGKIYDLSLEDKHIMKVWFEALSDFNIEEVTKAVQRYIKSPDYGSFKPKPADVIRMIEGTSIDKSFAAWSKVEKGARRVGSYQTVVFDDPIIHRVIEDMGGWVAICQVSEKELPFVSKEFCTRYKGFSSRQEIPAHCTRLYGLIDAQNAANGYHGESTPVMIGDVAKARFVLEGRMLPESEMILLPN